MAQVGCVSGIRLLAGSGVFPVARCGVPIPDPADANLEMPAAVTSLSYTAIRNITDRHMNPNGCVMPATWFVMAQDTQPDLVRQLYSAGHEIATQTLTGPGMPNATEIVGCRTWLNQVAGHILTFGFEWCGS